MWTGGAVENIFIKIYHNQTVPYTKYDNMTTQLKKYLIQNMTTQLEKVPYTML